MLETERLQSRIKEQEYKYREALKNKTEYSILKSMKEKIRKSKEMLQIAVQQNR